MYAPSLVPCLSPTHLLDAREVEDAIADADESERVAEDDGGADGQAAQLGKHVLCCVCG